MGAPEVSPQVLKEGTQNDRGDTARIQYFVGAIAIGDMIKTTLGPKGMDKILLPIGTEGAQREKSTITNDGATILKSVWLDNPGAQILVDLSKHQDKVVGDGTTGVVVLAAELLREAERLVEQKVHPQIICDGYRMALVTALSMLEKITLDISQNEDERRAALMKVAATTLSSKLLSVERDLFAKMAVDAVMRLRGEKNLELIQIIKKTGGCLEDSFLDEGFILEKRIDIGQPRVMEDCRVLVANTPMDADKIKLYGARVKVDSFEAVRVIEEAEKGKMKEKVDKILKHGCNVFVNRQLIYNYPDELFREAGIMAIEHSDFEGMERLSKVLGADIVSTFDNPERTRLGSCKRIEEIMIGEDKLIKFSGCAQNGACSIVIRGANLHVLDEAERSLHDALAVLSQTAADARFVYGGGAPEMALSVAVDQLAQRTAGKKALAIEAFARALRQIPSILLDNGGFDAPEVVSQLRALHTEGLNYMGVDLVHGIPGDMRSIGVLETHKAKSAQIGAAVDAAEMIIRCDEIIRCAPRKREGY